MEVLRPNIGVTTVTPPILSLVSDETYNLGVGKNRWVSMLVNYSSQEPLITSFPY